MNELKPRPQAADLSAAAFKGVAIWLPALLMTSLQKGEPLIRDRTFEDCLLHGPAVFLALGGVDLESCNMGWAGGDLRNLVLRPASPTSVIGTIPFQNCRIHRCDFDAVGFTGSERFVQSILNLPGVDPS